MSVNPDSDLTMFQCLYFYHSDDGETWHWIGSTTVWSWGILYARHYKKKYMKCVLLSVLPTGAEATVIRNTFTGEMHMDLLQLTGEEVQAATEELEIQSLEDWFKKSSEGGGNA